MNEEDYEKSILENLAIDTNLTNRYAGFTLIDMYTVMLNEILSRLDLKEYLKKDLHKKKMIIEILLGVTDEHSKILDDLWNKFRGSLAHNHQYFPNKSEIMVYFDYYKLIKKDLIARIDKLNNKLNEKLSFEVLFHYLFNARLNVLKSRINNLTNNDDLPSLIIPIPLFDKTLNDLKNGISPTYDTLLIYERLLSSLYETYTDNNIGNKISSEIKRLTTDLSRSYIEIYECINCKKGFICKEKDNTPGFKESTFRWCKYCLNESKIGELVYYYDFSPTNLPEAIPKKYLENMLIIAEKSDLELMNRIWENSNAIIRPGGILYVDKTNSNINNEILQQYCLLDLAIDSLDDIDWNSYAGKHRNFLQTSEGKEKFKKKLSEGGYGRCPICKSSLLPIGRRNKPYIASLYLVCPCTFEVITHISEIDGAIYGTWYNSENKDYIWVNDLKQNCSNHKKDDT